MITHTSDSHQIPSQNNTKSKLQILKNCQNFKFYEILQETLHATHLLKLLYKMYKYVMDPTRTVEATERTRDAGRTQDGRTDGWSETNIPPQQLRCAGGIIRHLFSATSSFVQHFVAIGEFKLGLQSGNA